MQDPIIKDFQSKYGEDSIMFLSERGATDIDVIPTGSIGIDIATGIGGLPRGRIIEIFGPESSGKTTLALHIIAEAQKKGDICAYIDAENSLDPSYARNLGIDMDKLYFTQPISGEQGLDMLEGMIRADVKVIIVDSVAALTPKDEIEGEMGANQMGKQARLMGHALRKLVSIIAKKNALVIFINQIRMNIGTYGNPETTPGGKALKFYTSLRIDIRKSASLKQGETLIGVETKVKVVKNKVATPYNTAGFDIIFGKGISKESEILELGTTLELFSKQGQSVMYKKESLGRTRNQICSNIYLKMNEIINDLVALSKNDLTKRVLTSYLKNDK